MIQNASALLSCRPCHLGRPHHLDSPVRFALFLVSALALFAAFTAALPGAAHALPPTRLLVEKTALPLRDGLLHFSFSATVDDEEGLRELLKDGAVLELQASLSIERERSWWANAEVFAAVNSSVLRHDPLSRDFIVIFPDRDGERELRDRNLTRLLYESWKNLSFPLVAPESLSQLDGESYVLNYTITLRHIEVPPWLEKSLVFWSAEVVPPEKGSLPIPLPGR